MKTSIAIASIIAIAIAETLSLVLIWQSPNAETNVPKYFYSVHDYIRGVDQTSGTVTIRGQQFYMATPRTDYPNKTEINFKSVSFSFPYGAKLALTPGGAITESIITFEDGKSYRLAVGIPANSNIYTTASLTNHTDPQAGLVVYGDEIRILVSSEPNQSSASQILENLKDNPNMVTTEQSGFIQGITLLNPTISDFVKGKDWGFVCCTFMTDSQPPKISMSFVDKDNNRQLDAVFDLDEAKVVKTEIHDSFNTGGQVQHGHVPDSAILSVVADTNCSHMKLYYFPHDELLKRHDRTGRNALMLQVNDNDVDNVSLLKKMLAAIHDTSGFEPYEYEKNTWTKHIESTPQGQQKIWDWLKETSDRQFGSTTDGSFTSYFEHDKKYYQIVWAVC